MVIDLGEPKVFIGQVPQDLQPLLRRRSLLMNIF